MFFRNQLMYQIGTEEEEAMNIKAAFAGKTESGDDNNGGALLEPRSPSENPVARIFGRYASYTTLHSLPNIHSAHHWQGRLFWSCVFVFCITAFCWQLSILVEKYSQYPKNIQLDMRFETMPFPAVTFCSLNPFEEPKAITVNKIKELKEAYEKAMKSVKAKKEITPKKLKRSLAGSELVRQSCLHQPGEQYFIPSAETTLFTKAQLKGLVTKSCLCVNDQWNFTSYCAPEPYWLKMACKTINCLADNYCGSYKQSFNFKFNIVNPTEFQECLCNLLADGCYVTNPSVLESLKSKGEFNDAEISNPLERTDYNFLFENMTDEMAVQSSAKETLLFIGAEIPVEKRKEISYKKEDLIKLCSFNGEQCNIANDFHLRMDPFFGNCYTFNWNASRNLSSTRAGAIYGLRVMLQAPIQDYLFTAESAGVRLSIHSPNNEPFPEVFGQSAPNGYVSAFGIKLERMEYLGAPYGDCVKDSANSPGYIYNESYSVEGCYRSCYQNKVLAMCGCGDPRFPVSLGRQTCPSDNLYRRQCLNQVANLLGNFNKVTGCSCPKPCKESVFTAIYSGAIWPARDSNLSPCKPPSTKDCLDNFKRNTAVIEVYFDRLNFQLLKESPSYGFTTMISDIGGIMGLWLGASVATCLEFLAVIGEFLRYLWGGSCREEEKTEECITERKRPSSISLKDL